MIDWTKPIQTRDGRKARLLATDFKCRDGSPYAVLITHYDSSGEAFYRFRENGIYWTGEGDYNDIINVPEKRVRAKIYLVQRKDRGLGKPSIQAYGVRQTIGPSRFDYLPQLEFYCEMLETDAIERGLEYEEIK